MKKSGDINQEREDLAINTVANAMTERLQQNGMTSCRGAQKLVDNQCEAPCSGHGPRTVADCSVRVNFYWKFDDF